MTNLWQVLKPKPNEFDPGFSEAEKGCKRITWWWRFINSNCFNVLRTILDNDIRLQARRPRPFKAASVISQHRVKHSHWFSDGLVLFKKIDGLYTTMKFNAVMGIALLNRRTNLLAAGNEFVERNKSVAIQVKTMEHWVHVLLETNQVQNFKWV